MPRSRKGTAAPPILRARLQVGLGGEIAMGPGKADLLEGIRDTGSIAQAASRMEMSYMRAWGLVRTMNSCFREPVVVAERGGSGRGGARLTPSGVEVLALYREMEAQTRASTAATWERLHRLLAAP